MPSSAAAIDQLSCTCHGHCNRESPTIKLSPRRKPVALKFEDDRRVRILVFRSIGTRGRAGVDQQADVTGVKKMVIFDVGHHNVTKATSDHKIQVNMV
jgi:hypothetical protein